MFRMRDTELLFDVSAAMTLPSLTFLISEVLRFGKTSELLKPGPKIYNYNILHCNCILTFEQVTQLVTKRDSMELAMVNIVTL